MNDGRDPCSKRGTGRSRSAVVHSRIDLVEEPASHEGGERESVS
jgi:hypothetical protein